jgi:hypothetical protein
LVSGRQGAPRGVSDISLKGKMADPERFERPTLRFVV